MISRYNRPKIEKIWSDANKFGIWTEIECLVAEQLSNIGKIPKKDAKIIRKKSQIKTIAAGMINNKKLANKLLKNKYSDLVQVSRRFIKEPNWLFSEYVKSNKINKNIPKQYLRCF